MLFSREPARTHISFSIDPGWSFLYLHDLVNGDPTREEPNWTLHVERRPHIPPLERSSLADHI